VTDLHRSVATVTHFQLFEYLPDVSEATLWGEDSSAQTSNLFWATALLTSAISQSCWKLSPLKIG